MLDDINTPIMNNGHYPNISNVLLDIYRILTIFMASKSIAELEESHLYKEDDPLQQFAVFESDEITRILLTVSITVRVVDERESKIMGLLADDCGHLVPDTNKPAPPTSLSIREACNKIMHASKIEFGRATLPNGRSFLQPWIYLFGTDFQKKNAWKANLNVVQFSRECAAILKLLSRKD